jgi:AcrR family transcriptional regulator
VYHSEPATRQPSGGRGARERILWAAGVLFYNQGINSTGIEELTTVAHVSKRTFYLHFSSKDELIQAYLRRWDSDWATTGEGVLDRDDLTPRERLLGLFDEPTGVTVMRGCPFHNATVEVADPDSPARELVLEHKRAVTARIAAVARDAGAADPPRLARQLAVLFDGARALATSTNNFAPFRDAQDAAEVLLNSAAPPASGVSPLTPPPCG